MEPLGHYYQTDNMDTLWDVIIMEPLGHYQTDNMDTLVFPVSNLHNTF